MKTKDLLFVIIQFVLIIVFIFIPAGPAQNYWYQIPAFVLTLTGIVIFSIAILKLGNSLTPMPTPKVKAQLINNGIYKYIRHPIYTGVLISTLGIAIYTFSIPRLIMCGILYIFFNYKSRYEEEMLNEKYQEYAAYTTKTGRFFPKLF